MAKYQGQKKRCIDPRAKIFAGICAILSVFLAKSLFIISVQSLLGLSAFIIVNPSLKGFRHMLKFMLPMMGLVFIVALISYDISTSIILSMRLFTLFIVSAAVFGSFNPSEMGDTIRLLGISHRVAAVFSSGIRYVPLLTERLGAIMDAQKSRGIDLTFSFKNLKNFFALMTPFLIQAFILSDHLAISLESRGFDKKKRTMRNRYKFKYMDFAVIVGATLTTVFFMWVR